MTRMPLDDFAREMAQKTPTPAGGAAAAVAAALGAALAGMVGRIALGKAPEGEDVGQLIEAADLLRERLLALATEDGQAYSAVLAAKKDLSGGEQEQEARVRAAWRKAAHVPAEVVRLSREVATLARRAVRAGPASTGPDAVMAALLAAAAAAGSQLNLRANVLAAGRPEDLRVLADQSEIALRETQRATAEARHALEERLHPGR